MQVLHVNVNERAIRRNEIFLVFYAENERVSMTAYYTDNPERIADALYIISSSYDYSAVVGAVKRLFRCSKVCGTIVSGPNGAKLYEHLNTVYPTSMMDKDPAEQGEKIIYERLYRVRDRLSQTLESSIVKHINEELPKGAIDAALYCMSLEETLKFIQCPDEDIMYDVLRVFCRASDIDNHRTLLGDDGILFTPYSTITELDLNCEIVDKFFLHDILFIGDLERVDKRIPKSNYKAAREALNKFDYHRRLN